MSEAWPAGVPYAPLANSFQGTAFRAPDVTEMEDGPRRQRRRSTLTIATLRFTIRMSNAEFAIFKNWVGIMLVDGTLPFNMAVWSGETFVFKTCRFREPYADNPGQGLRHRVGVVLDVEDY